MTALATPKGVRRSHRGVAGRRVSPVVTTAASTAAVVTAIPLIYLVIQANSEGLAALWEEVWRRRVLDLAVRSLGLALVVSVACLLIGSAAAFAVIRTDLPGRRIFRILMALPLSMPSYVAAYAWVSWQPGLAGFWGAALVLTSVSFPFVFLPVAAALRRLDPAQEEVARALGRTPLQIALGLTARQVRPAAAAGTLLVALYVLSDFGAVATMRFESFTWVIFGAYRAGFNPTRAAILSLVLVALALVIVLAEARVRGRGEASRIGSGSARPVRIIPLGWARWPVAVSMAVIVAISLALPLVVIVSWLSRREVPIEWDRVFSATTSTLGVAALATVLTVALALPVGVLAARSRSLVSRSIERTTFVAHALPGIVIAISVVFVGIRLVPELYQRLPMLVFAYAVLFCSLAVGVIRSSVEQTPVGVDDVARSLGLSRLRVLFRITIPLARPGLLAGAALVFLTVMKELPATLLLRPIGTETLATELWRNTTVSDYAGAAPYAVVLIVFAALPAALLSIGRNERYSAASIEEQLASPAGAGR